MITGDEIILRRRRRGGYTITVYWALFLVLLVLRMVWGLSLDAELNAELQAVRAGGEAVTLAELEQPPLPDAQNAAVLYRQAFATPLLMPESKDNSEMSRLADMLWDLVGDPDYRHAHRGEVEQILRHVRDVLPLCRQARKLSQASWGPKRLPFDSRPWKNGVSARRLGKLLCLAALEAHRAKDDAAVLEYLQDELALVRLAPDDDPGVMRHLVRLSIGSMAVSVLEEMLPALAATGDHAAAQQQMRAVMHGLLDESALAAGLVQASIEERLATQWLLGRLPPEPVDVSDWLQCFVMVRAIEPFIIGYRTQALQYGRQLVTGARETDYPSASIHLRAAEDAVARQRRAWKPFSSLVSLLIPTFNRAFVLHFRDIAMRRMAAVALAIRLYELDHGQRPERLDQLVPKYLPAVPVDPFAADGSAVRYAGQASPPRLYSVNLDGVDNGGAYELWNDGDVDPDKADLPFFLNGQRPRKRVQSAATASGPSQPAP